MNEPTSPQPPETKAAPDERDSLLSVAAHEIRTPLASLRLYLDAVIKAADRGSLDAADVGVRLRKARRQCDRLNVLLNDLIGIARAPAGPLAVPLTPVDLVATVVGVCDHLRDQLTAEGRELEVVTSEPVWGSWDRARLEQVVTNLVSNAQKHAPGAPVRVEVQARADDRVALIVSDKGPGIPAENQQRIFQRPAKGASTEGGMGVGLWIVARIAEAFGGSVRLDSPPGGGATFTVDLPRAPA